ncbi:hypothetical protein ACQKCO_05075 [Shewanella baltica]|uniref:hypothetical protein n=1 Tax=Shewanella baltica TaxID=62322 RepID=UPI003D02EA5B
MDLILPHRDSDPVLVLYAHYFTASDVMLKNYKKLINKNKQLNQNDRVELSIYFCTWIGFLGVTSEGFKKLRIRKLLEDQRPHEFKELISKANDLGKMMNTHGDELRKFRNKIFHLRDSTQELTQFLEKEPCRREWAQKLHVAFNDFFSEYRVLCQVHYVITNRHEEFFT